MNRSARSRAFEEETVTVRDCDTFARGPTSWPLEPYARVLAHEQGHFLGLFQPWRATAPPAS